MRLILDRIFLGRYREDCCSSAGILKTQERLHEGFGISCGLQQGCGDLDKKEIIGGHKEIQDIVSDIAMALTGQEIIFKKDASWMDSEEHKTLYDSTEK